MRDIEILVQQQLETLQAEEKDDPLLREIQKILYSTEVRHHPPRFPVIFAHSFIPRRRASRSRRAQSTRKRRSNHRNVHTAPEPEEADADARVGEK